jgi:hypothetical protein
MAQSRPIVCDLLFPPFENSAMSSLAPWAVTKSKLSDTVADGLKADETVADVPVGPVPVPIADVTRPLQAKIASTSQEWREAFQLLAATYRARGYEAADSELRFTPHNALPDTVTFVAKENDRVLATLSMVPDNTLLGLPMECLFREEIDALRAKGKRLMEVTGLADHKLSLREFTPVFLALMRFVAQYASLNGATSWVIAVNPRHRLFYQRILGFVPFGEPKEYPSVQNHPAEAYYLDVPLLKRRPEMFRKLFGQFMRREALMHWPMSEKLIREFGRQSAHTDQECIDSILRYVARNGSPKRWR